MPKQYDLIPELDDFKKDISDIIRAGDMGRNKPDLLLIRAALDMLKIVLIPLSLGFLIFRFFFAKNPDQWWLTVLTIIAGLYMAYWLIRTVRRIYLQTRLTNPDFEWRPGGSYMVMKSDKAIWEGQSEFACPCCFSGKHTYTLRLTRLNLNNAGYIPALFDPIFPLSLEYNRKIRVPLVCPGTGTVFQGTLNIRQTALNAILDVEVL